MQVPIEWILSGVLALFAVIGAMARVMWASLNSRIVEQGKVIDAQEITITKLQEDVGRLSKGCGLDSCIWGRR